MLAFTLLVVNVAWLMHTVWDVLHYLYGKQILPFVAHSSLGCAICYPVISLWCFSGGPSVLDIRRYWGSRGARTIGGDRT